MWKYTFYSEGTKFFSYHWCIYGIIGAILLPSVALLFGENISMGTMIQSKDIVAICLLFLYLGQTGIIIAMAGFLGQEYSRSVLRTTLLTNASRMRLLLAKKAIIVFITIIAGILSAVLCFIVVIIKYQCGMRFDLIVEFMAAIPLAISSWIWLGLISAHLAIINKSLIVPIIILFPMILGLSQMIMAITEVAKYLPDLAGMNLFLMPEQPPFLSVWAGMIIQFIWAILFDCISTYLFCKRDVR